MKTIRNQEVEQVSKTFRTSPSHIYRFSPHLFGRSQLHLHRHSHPNETRRR